MVKIIGIASGNLGTDGQERGVILTGYKINDSQTHVPETRQVLLKAMDGRVLHRNNFASEEEFAYAIKQSVDSYLQNEDAPEYVLLPYDHATSKPENEVECIDTLSKYVKMAFSQRGADVKTMAIACALGDYPHVDCINVCAHQLTDEDEAKLAANFNLKSKTIKTFGVASNISWLRINQEANSPQKKAIVDKFRNKKNVLFSLGGKTENLAIKFTIDDAKQLLTEAEKLKKLGYNIIFTNSPRTPNDVTDFLYEKCREKGMDFFNSKKVAQSEEDKKNFRIYDGKYNAEFAKQLEQVGNIYPAILSLFEPDKFGTNKGFVVNTHDSFSYTSDAAALGIPSVVYTGNEIDSSRADCHKLFRICEERGYVVDLETAVKKASHMEKITTRKMDDVAKQLVMYIEHSTLSLTQQMSKNNNLGYKGRQ